MLDGPDLAIGFSVAVLVLPPLVNAYLAERRGRRAAEHYRRAAERRLQLARSQLADAQELAQILSAPIPPPPNSNPSRPLGR